MRHWRDGGPWTALVPLTTYMHLFVPRPPELPSCECTLWVYLVGVGVGCTPPSVDGLPVVFHAWLCACFVVRAGASKDYFTRHSGKVLCPIHTHIQSFASSCAPCCVPRSQILNRCQVLEGTRCRRSGLSIPHLVHANPRSTNPHSQGPVGTGHASPANAQHR